MKAAIYRKYGGPEVVAQGNLLCPEAAAGEVLVQVEAAAVTSADWRLRAAAFPSFTWLPGRLMFGLVRPRKPVLGGAFAGVVAEVGSGATRFAVGDRVFGFSGLGAHAEYLALPETAAITHRPAGITAEQAASLPFGGLSALVFLRDIARLQPGERVLVIGASGGVGLHAVQIARSLGADVDGVCSVPHADLVQGLGARRVFDYRSEDFSTSGETWDVILDCVGATDFRTARNALSQDGRFVPLNMDWSVIFALLTNPFRRGPKIATGVSPDRREDLATLAEMVSSGVLKPVVDRVYPLAEVRAAHQSVESRHRAGSVVLTMA